MWWAVVPEVRPAGAVVVEDVPAVAVGLGGPAPASG